MFPAPLFLLILTLTLIHAPFFHAIPVTEEQRHQTTHRTTHSDVAHMPPLEDHQETPLPVQSQHEKGEDKQEREVPVVQSPSSIDDEDELFKDISPKALAAVLLKALNPNDGEQTPTVSENMPPSNQELVKEQTSNVEEENLTESVRSKTRSSDQEETIKEDEKTGEGEDMESVKSLLQELEAFEPPSKKEQDPPQEGSLDNEDLQELRELLGIGEQTEEEKRNPMNPIPHTPRGLEEEEEEREEDEKLANVAQDLLLQYLINGSENDDEDEEEEEEEKENEQDNPVDDVVGGQLPLFEDEEVNIQSKRSKDDDIEEVDPQTIDKLIELSSRLHLPADDVVDIINDVEKRKRRRMKKKKARDDFLGRKERIRNPPQSWQESAYYPRRKLDQQSSWNKIDTNWKKPSSPAWKNRLSESTWKKLSNPIWTKSSKSNWNKVSEPSWNKVSEPSWNKVSQSNWNKVPEPSWNKMPQSSWNKVSEPSWNKVSEPSWNKVSEPSWNKVSEPSWNKVSEPSWNKVSQPSWNKVSEPSWNKAYKPGWNKVPESSWNEVSKPSWDKVTEPSWNKVDPSWNKVSEPSWNKVPDTNWNKVSEQSWSNLPDTKWNKMQESSWNKASQPSWMKAMDPYTRRYRARPAPYTNYIWPRTFQNPPRYYYKPPVPQLSDYFDDDQDKQEEMENYIERILLTHPEVFQ